MANSIGMHKKGCLGWAPSSWPLPEVGVRLPRHTEVWVTGALPFGEVEWPRGFGTPRLPRQADTGWHADTPESTWCIIFSRSVIGPLARVVGLFA